MSSSDQIIAVLGALEIDPSRFLETIGGGPLGGPDAQLEARHGRARFPPSFSLSLARKDAALALETAAAAAVYAGLAEQ